MSRSDVACWTTYNVRGSRVRALHVAAGYAVHVVALVSACPELVSSLSLICPSRFDAEPLKPRGPRVLYIHS